MHGGFQKKQVRFYNKVQTIKVPAESARTFLYYRKLRKTDLAVCIVWIQENVDRRATISGDSPLFYTYWEPIEKIRLKIFLIRSKGITVNANSTVSQIREKGSACVRNIVPPKKIRRI